MAGAAHRRRPLLHADAAQRAARRDRARVHARGRGRQLVRRGQGYADAPGAADPHRHPLGGGAALADLSHDLERASPWRRSSRSDGDGDRGEEPLSRLSQPRRDGDRRPRRQAGGPSAPGERRVQARAASHRARSERAPGEEPHVLLLSCSDMLPARRMPMKRALALLAIFLVLFVAILPGSASAAGGWHHGHRGGHGGWWWPGALIGGLALGAVALATAPLWALTPPPAPVAPAPVVMQAPQVMQAPPVMQAPAAYAQPAYSASATLPVPPPGSAPVAYAPAPAASYQPAQTYAAAQAPAVQREVIHDNGRYVLYGDGVRQPWQWVWVPAAAPPPPPPPPR